MARDVVTKAAEKDSLIDFVKDMEAALKIDKNDLDREVQEQADLFWRVGDRLALQISRRDKAKSDLENLLADTDQNIREKHSRDEKKPTEKAIEAEITSDPQVIRAKEDVQALTYWVNRLAALKDAFHQRKDMVREMCGLYATNYFTVGTVNSRQSDSKTRDAEQARSRLAEKRRAEA